MKRWKDRAAAARGVVGIVDYEAPWQLDAWAARIAGGADALRVVASVWPEALDGSDGPIARGLRSGDVEWWDYRSWARRMRTPVVVGAFPQPFVSGFDGHQRPTVVQYDDATRTQALALGKRLHARTLPVGRPIGPAPNVLRLTCRGATETPTIQARFRFGDGRPGAPILYTVDCAPNFERLARLRYEVPR